MSDHQHISPHEAALRDTARTMLDSYSAKLTKLVKDYPDTRHVMRSNEMGYKYQAVDFIVDMAKTYHANQQQAAETLTVDADSALKSGMTYEQLQHEADRFLAHCTQLTLIDKHQQGKPLEFTINEVLGMAARVAAERAQHARVIK